LASYLQSGFAKRIVRFIKTYIMHSFKQLCSGLFFCLVLVSCTDEEPILIQDTEDSKDKFIGTWNVREETENQVTGNYTSVVTSNPNNTSQIIINNIYNLGSTASISALVANNSLSISQANITGVSISGSGTYSGSGFILNLTVDEGDGPKQVKTTYSK
jgi:hypothetical protein